MITLFPILWKTLPTIKILQQNFKYGYTYKCRGQDVLLLVAGCQKKWGLCRGPLFLSKFLKYFYRFLIVQLLHHLQVLLFQILIHSV